jgi:triphosphoribosyl-dephospho-CoA synthase
MDQPTRPHSSIAHRVQRAIALECSTHKLGNVHPYASFSDLSYSDFLLAARVIGNRIDQYQTQPVGKMILASVSGMMRIVKTNTSLGTILLIAPLAKAITKNNSLAQYGFSSCVQWQIETNAILGTLNSMDACDIYESIAIAKPGGLGKSDSMDVADSPPDSIVEAMQVASSRDDVALQYVTQFSLVFELARRLDEKQKQELNAMDCIRCLQLELLSERIDSLIARKAGQEQAGIVQQEAQFVMNAGPYGSPAYERAWLNFDKRLRDPLHRYNPGTTADLIAAALFVLGPAFNTPVDLPP